ncbi:hypothetical protein CR513_45864, partial [Mucuna pruriens]
MESRVERNFPRRRYQLHSKVERNFLRRSRLRHGVERNFLGRFRLRRHPFVDGIIETPELVYVTNQLHHLTLVALVNLRQEEDESLRTFTKCFFSCSHENQRFEFGSGTSINDNNTIVWAISNSLCKKQLASMDELRERVSKCVQMEEMAEFRNHIRVEHVVKP